MQRKRNYDYRDYSDTLELGQAFEIVKSARSMRKFAMKRMLKFVVLLVFGYIVFSVYSKYRLAHSRADSFQDTIEVSKRTFDKDHRGNKDAMDRKFKDKLNKVVEEFKRAKDADGNKFMADEDIDKLIQDKLQEADIERAKSQNDNILKFQNVVEQKRKNDGDRKSEIDREGKIENDKKEKIEVEVVDNVKEIDIDDKKADFIKIDQSNIRNEPLDTREKNVGNDDAGLEKEIEERLAEALKDAANKVGEEREELEAKLDHQKGENLEKKEAQIEEKLEQEEFHDIEKNLETNFNPETIEELQMKFAKRKAKHDDDHEMPPFVTAVSQSTFNAVLHLLYSIQMTMPGETVHVYDLDLEDNQRKTLMTICDVKVQMFMKELFPKYFNNLDNMHWRPLVMQTALAEFGHMIWINPGFKLTSHEFGQVVHDSHETGVFVISEEAGYSTYAVTHPGMYKFIPVDAAGMEKLKKDPHLEIKMMIIHNTQEIHEKFMKHFTACAMEESCLAPIGAKWKCSFDFTGRRYASCHRYDESVANILLKRMFRYDTSKFSVSKASMFRTVDRNMPPPTNKLKYCKRHEDITDDDL